MGSKVTVVHWLNDRLIETEEGYPVYVRLIYRRKNYQFKSLLVSGRYRKVDQIPISLKEAECKAIKSYVRSAPNKEISVRGFRAFMSSRKRNTDAEIIIRFQVRDLLEKEEAKKLTDKEKFVSQLIEIIDIGNLIEPRTI